MGFGLLVKTTESEFITQLPMVYLTLNLVAESARYVALVLPDSKVPFRNHWYAPPVVPTVADNTLLESVQIMGIPA